MTIRIPNELQKYVRMSKKDGLVHSDDMPIELMPLFEKIREHVSSIELRQKNELEELMSVKKRPDMSGMMDNTKY